MRRIVGLDALLALSTLSESPHLLGKGIAMEVVSSLPPGLPLIVVQAPHLSPEAGVDLREVEVSSELLHVLLEHTVHLLHPGVEVPHQLIVVSFLDVEVSNCSVMALIVAPSGLGAVLEDFAVLFVEPLDGGLFVAVVVNGVDAVGPDISIPNQI